MISFTSIQPLPDAYSINTTHTQADVQISIRPYSIPPRSICDPFRFCSIATRSYTITTRAYLIATQVYPIATRPYTSALTLNTFLQKRIPDQAISHQPVGTLSGDRVMVEFVAYCSCKNRVLNELFVNRL